MKTTLSVTVLALLVIICQAAAVAIAWPGTDAVAFHWWPGSPTSNKIACAKAARVANGVLNMTGGSAKGQLSAAIEGTGAVEFAFTPSAITPETTGKIIDIAGTIAIWQRGERILLGVKGQPDEFLLAELADASMAHMAVVFTGGKVCAYLNGVLTHEYAFTKTLKCAAKSSVQFAPSVKKTARWRGTLSAFAIYSHVMTAEEITGAAATLADYARLLDNVKGQRVLMRATITNLTPTPTPESVLPYRHALIVFEYRVEGMVAGTSSELKPGALLRVARWGVLGGKQTETKDARVGDTQLLVAEPFDARPDLADQYTVNTLPENFDLSYWIEVN